MTTDITPGPAIDCEFGCGTVSPISERDAKVGNDTCPACEEPGTIITIVACGKGAACEDDDHHYGTGFHHVGET